MPNYRQWLEEYPEALYGAKTRNQTLPWGGGRSPWENYWANRYSGVRQGYMGQLAQQALRGEEPSQSWAGYLGAYPFQEQWYSQSPMNRGERPWAYSPRSRWLVY